ncbi:MAG: hypothetical protein ABSD42_09780 [Candidatus Bathyarchaeia archaeon]|jgi:glucan phosphoethanolaminetransferase (alkaline phosphatase superfamily)
MDKEAELLKIQIYADYLHTQYNSYFSFLFGFVIAGIIFSLTALSEHLISFESNLEVVIAILTVFLAIGIYANTIYGKEIMEIFDMVDALVEKNELPNLEKLRKTSKQKPKT